MIHGSHIIFFYWPGKNNINQRRFVATRFKHFFLLLKNISSREALPNRKTSSLYLSPSTLLKVKTPSHGRSSKRRRFLLLHHSQRLRLLLRRGYSLHAFQPLLLLLLLLLLRRRISPLRSLRRRQQQANRLHDPVPRP